MRMLKTIRLDASDALVFECAAEPGEWAVSGAFAFADAAPEDLTGKSAQAFRNGFLGLGSFGRSTLAVVASIDEPTFDTLVEALAVHFVDRYGAPGLEAARPVAREELRFAAALCEHPVNTLIAVERELGEEGIVERFRAIRRDTPGDHAPVWEIADDGD